MLLLSYGGPHITSPLVLNSAATPALVEWRSGVTHRLRLINITGEEHVEFALDSHFALAEWRAVAKDGADLPPVQATRRSAHSTSVRVETADFEITPAAGDLRLTAKGEGSSVTLPCTRALTPGDPLTTQALTHASLLEEFPRHELS